MRFALFSLGTLIVYTCCVQCLQYLPEHAQWNLNTNQAAKNPLEYSGAWEDHDYFPSPNNWRFPIYSLFLDRYVNGDPQNDNANGTLFEQDITSTQFRHGGDVQGLLDSLDYIQGFGIRGIYIVGSPFINMPWQYDMYSPLDLTLLDRHFGNITVWRRCIDEIHKRGMYVIFDNTVTTMGDLIGFEGYLNKSAPFVAKEHKFLWKGPRRYYDFAPSNRYNQTCNFPRFWNDTGFPVDDSVNREFRGCYNGDFDQFGDTEASGIYPDYRRQLTKLSSVQDRLREWVPSVRERLEHFSCLTIRMLDIDGFRFDKAIQVTVDASAQFYTALRACARDVGKENFFLSGEISGGNNVASVYFGRGRQPDQWLQNLTEAVAIDPISDNGSFLRGRNHSALDSGAFHYSVYRILTRFLGMDGNLETGHDLPTDWVDAWNQMLLSNDFINANTGQVDPRHMLGTANQDVFRWPALHQGVERFLLGQFITVLLMPGIPLLLWGEEVGFNILDNTADNYLFGRQAMSPSPAWHMHGCYAGSSTQYFKLPLDSAKYGCKDETNTYDHRDPSHPIRVILRELYYLRTQFPALNDGLLLSKLSKQTEMIAYPGSNGVETETGLWSIRRAPFQGVKDFGGPSDIWLVFHNRNETTKYSFDCAVNGSAMVSPFDTGSIVKNLVSPHDELHLINGPVKLGIDGSEAFNGCVEEIELAPYEFRLYVPNDRFTPLPPMITKFLPGHDYPYIRANGVNEIIAVNISLQFSAEMDCSDLTKKIDITSSTFLNLTARIDENSISCEKVEAAERAPYVAAVASAWSWSAQLIDVADGVHSIAVHDVMTADGRNSTKSTDKFLIRIGKVDNPIVFLAANYSKSLLSLNKAGELILSHKAAGANKWRYSLNWGSSWSIWEDLKDVNVTLKEQPWSGTNIQRWEGSHVMVQYWSQLLGSSSFMQHSDVGFDHTRRFPHIFANGPFNQFGFDSGLQNQFGFHNEGMWSWHFMAEWPSTVQLNVWGMDPDGQPDQSFIFGDIDDDNVLDRLNPTSLLINAINITTRPPHPHVAYRIDINDATLRYELVPVGNAWLQIALYIVLWITPLLSGFLAIAIYQRSFYQIKYEARGTTRRRMGALLKKLEKRVKGNRCSKETQATVVPHHGSQAVTTTLDPGSRRKVLFATIEYNIDDWNIKVRVGGLGVMAQLMGKALTHIDLVWVIPCVNGIEYPDEEHERADPMTIRIFDDDYTVTVHYHIVDNITFVLLDAPIFRTTDKANPYPPRMDDISSAVYYSTWNQCIAQALQRFHVDLYHINDYHGAAAPLYILPKTIPCCLSLHNAEFQGLWPMRTDRERDEVARVFNLPMKILEDYIQYGSVFNLLHAGVSYLRIHQSGFGAVGVSKKYGDRSFARYPIFWGLSSIGRLPNPDPSDIADWDKNDKIKKSEIHIDEEYEKKREDFRIQAQEWAGLEINPKAELFVFVGRWCEQKGIDLIADVFPSILETYPTTQLICVGPVIDLFGKFAALKLSKLMEQYPKRVFSHPEFTVLPPYIHTGAEFALIPSRDEPFGLVAVEFGRKGALGVGARVGGLGQMPGWWYTIESLSSAHLLKQFRHAIISALESKESERALMRVWSGKQRFPVAQWLERLEKLQSQAVHMHGKNKRNSTGTVVATPRPSTQLRPGLTTIHSNVAVLPGMAGDQDVSSAPPSTAPSATDELQDIGLASTAIERQRQRTQSISIHVPGPMDRSAGFDGQIQGDIPSIQLILDPDFQSRTTSAAPSFVTPSRRSSFHDNGHDIYHRYLGPSGWPSPQSSRLSSVVDLHAIVGERKDFALQQVDPSFTDDDEAFYKIFKGKLQNLSARNSTTELCTEDYIVNSTRTWFSNRYDAKVGVRSLLSGSTSDNTSSQRHNMWSRPDPKSPNRSLVNVTAIIAESDKRSYSFDFGDGYIAPKGLRKYLQVKIGTWPIYSFMLALGQIIASNSYQITLLTGEVGQSADKLYIITSVYLGFSLIWGILSRYVRLLYLVTVPFFFYGLAFLLIGASPLLHDLHARFWMQSVATACYAAASASGSLYFAFNFGDEGGAPITVWIWRACWIQGLEHAYTLALWFWGSFISSSSAMGNTTFHLSAFPVLLPVTLIIAIALWSIGIVLFIGLPSYYRQMPGRVPSLLMSITKRKITLWFFVAVILQNYFLSAPYGRSWAFLFSSKHISAPAILCLALGFLLGGWSVFMYWCAGISKVHPWWLCVFAAGLGAPRWAQMLWGTSNIGLYMPWAGSDVASALLSRCLWLWLGLMDGLQNTGIGMMLLLTLTRIHVSTTLIIAQVLGSIATIVARASAPNRSGPGDVFPDFSRGLSPSLTRSWFWVALIAQLILCLGFFKFFRKEQISKP